MLPVTKTHEYERVRQVKAGYNHRFGVYSWTCPMCGKKDARLLSRKIVDEADIGHLGCVCRRTGKSYEVIL